MGNKFLKLLVLLFFTGVVVFSVITFLSKDLNGKTVYHQKHEKYMNGEYVGIECYGKGTDCKIEIIGKVPYLRP